MLNGQLDPCVGKSHLPIHQPWRRQMSRVGEYSYKYEMNQDSRCQLGVSGVLQERSQQQRVLGVYTVLLNSSNDFELKIRVQEKCGRICEEQGRASAGHSEFPDLT